MSSYDASILMPAVGLGQPFAHASFMTLVRLKVTALRNRVNQLLDESPLRVFAGASFILVIWISLYVMFSQIFGYLQQFPEQRPVALPYIFHIFFLAMTVLLLFSSAVLSYGAFFSREEPAFLLVGPTPTTHIVGIVYLESLFFSSWAMVLLGVPLMLALGQVEELPWYFFLLFIGSFVGFVPIPASLGMLAAWAVARFVPRSSRRVLIIASMLVVVGGVVTVARLWGTLNTRNEGPWLDMFIRQISVVKSAFLPSTWASQSIRYALQSQLGSSLFYLYVTFAHAALFSWLSIGIAARGFRTAYGRARSRTANRPGSVIKRVVSAASRVVFPHLSSQMRTLVLKDMITFIRDPLQWSQLAIMMGLLALYLFYVPQFNMLSLDGKHRVLYAFLNYCGVILILSTFTSRFVFPMISMEGRQIWLVGLWPMSRTQVVWAKFQFAFAVTATAGVIVTLFSVRAINLPPMFAIGMIGTMLTSCFGLCGLAIGLGALLPNYTERSAARIAAGLGGTVNLIASLVFVALCMLFTGLACYWLYRSADSDLAGRLVLRMQPSIICVVIGQFALGILTGWTSMKIGTRRFERAEF